MRPRFREGEIVQIGPEGLTEGIVEELVGANDTGDDWLITVRRPRDADRDELVQLAETDLAPTGYALDERGSRVPISELVDEEALRNRIELRLFTSITDGIVASRAADAIEQELAYWIDGAAITILAERHWSAPYDYEFSVTLEELADPVEALELVVEQGSDGWISFADDGWRCDLWWSLPEEGSEGFLVREAHGAKLSFLPWESPRRRPSGERPLIDVDIVERAEREIPLPDPPDGSDTEPGDEEP